MRAIFQLLGWLLTLIGLGGISDDVAGWGSFFSKVHPYVSSPVVYVPLVLAGIGLLIYVYGNWLAGRIINSQATVRLQPANLEKWDQVLKPAIWQVAWLWNDLEPREGSSSGTPAYPTFQRLKEHLDSGRIKGAEKVDGSWMWFQPSRQSLIDYAIEIGERPKFLFPELRRFWLVRLLKRFRRVEIPISEISGYRPIFDLYMAGQEIEGNKLSVEETAKLLKKLLENGNAVAIGRRKRNGLRWPYEVIPRRKWKQLSLQFDRAVRGFDEEYGDLRVQIGQ